MKKLIIWIGATLLGTIILAAVWYFFFAPKRSLQTPPTSASLPISGSVTPIRAEISTASSSPAQSMILTTESGEIIVVNDFIHNGVTLPDGVNVGRYLLAGNLGYCPSNPQRCQAGVPVGFNIYYDNARQSFNIALIAEPIGQVRLEMEQFLRTTLGLFEQQMCKLRYLVTVPINVNSTFAGRNLGFSFCPGATVLPK